MHIIPVSLWACRLDHSKPYRVKFPTNAIFFTTLWIRAKSITLIFRRLRRRESSALLLSLCMHPMKCAGYWEMWKGGRRNGCQWLLWSMQVVRDKTLFGAIFQSLRWSLRTYACAWTHGFTPWAASVIDGKEKQNKSGDVNHLHVALRSARHNPLASYGPHTCESPIKVLFLGWGMRWGVWRAGNSRPGVSSQMLSHRSGTRLRL